jgi:hypothetical protein
MSVNPLTETDVGSGTPFKGTSQIDGCTPAARIRIAGTEIPCTEVEVDVRKTGPADINHVTTAKVPITWDGRSVADVIDGLSGGPNPTQLATVEVYDREDEQYAYVHHGWVRAAGGSTDAGIARIRIGDFAELFQKVPITYSFKDPNLGSVIDVVQKRLLGGQAVIDDVQFALQSVEDDTFVETEKPNQQAIIENRRESRDPLGEPLKVIGLAVDSAIKFSTSLFANQSFRRDKDSLADVMNFLADTLDARWYVTPYPDETDTPIVVLDRSVQTRSFHGKQTAAPGRELSIIKNNALFQLNPQYRLKVRGHSASSLGALGSGDKKYTDKFPTATATYEPLAERVGEVDGEPPEIGADVTTTGEAKNVARKELKDRLDSSTGGEMRLTPSPLVTPYSKITARPVCGDTALNDVPPIEYEAEEVIHYIPSGGDDDGEVPRTVVRCGLFIDDDAFTVTDQMNDIPVN